MIQSRIALCICFAGEEDGTKEGHSVLDPWLSIAHVVLEGFVLYYY